MGHPQVRWLVQRMTQDGGKTAQLQGDHERRSGSTTKSGGMWVNQAVLQRLNPEHVEVEIWRADELEVRRGLSSELDEMWSYVQAKAHPRWLWHAIDHHTGKVLAYVFGRRKDDVFLMLQKLLEPFGITKFYTDGWGAYV